MNNFEKLVFGLYSWRCEHHHNYDGFHLVYFFLIPLSALISGLIMRKRSAIAVRIFVLVCVCIMLLMETVKQILYSFNYDDITEKVTWKYTWYAFPFQMSSTTMYLGLLTSVVKKGKVQKALDMSLVIVMMGGVTAIFYPASVFVTSFVFIANQAMIHHGLMVVIGVVLMVSRVELTHKVFFLMGLLVYLGLTVIALIMDICFYYWYGKNNPDDEFNMFYISPFYDGLLPFIPPLRTSAYWAYLLIYIVVSSFYGMFYFFLVLSPNLYSTK
jgi:hypothetical protein